jgi:hypothetical protein
MMRAKKHMANAIDFAAAVVFAAAVAFAASSLSGGTLAALLAPTAFLLAFASLAQVDSDRPYRLPDFKLQPIEAQQDECHVVRQVEGRAAPSEGSGDAAETLSNALAQLKRSLR